MGYMEIFLYGFWNKNILAALFYGICSVSMAFLNKAVISHYDFNFPFSLMAFQMMLTIIFLQIMSRLKKIHIPTYSLKIAKRCMLLALAYAFHSVLSLMALRGMSIPIYTAVKRCTPLVNLVLAAVILHKPIPSTAIIVSVHTIIFGCIIAVYKDLKFDPLTYCVGALSVFAQGLYLTLVQKESENHLSVFEILQLTSYTMLVPFIIIATIASEPQKIIKFPLLTDPVFQLLLWSLLLAGILFSYSLFLCTSMNSALTTSLVGIAKSAVQTSVGFFVFPEGRYDIWAMTGILLNFAGALSYTYVKYRESKLLRLSETKSSIKTNSSWTEKDGEDNLKEIVTDKR